MRKLDSERFLDFADIPSSVATSSDSSPFVPLLNGSVVVAYGYFGDVVPVFLVVTKNNVEVF